VIQSKTAGAGPLEASWFPWNFGAPGIACSDVQLMHYCESCALLPTYLAVPVVAWFSQIKLESWITVTDPIGAREAD
jgi:hypothetical protein